MFGSINPELFNEIEAVIAAFVTSELLLNQTCGVRKDESVIFNLSTFDLGALASDRGIEQMSRLLAGTSHTQNTAIRLTSLLVYLHCRYGAGVIRRMSARTIDSICEVYSLPKETMNQMVFTYKTFWLVPYIKRGYQYHSIKIGATI